MPQKYFYRLIVILMILGVGLTVAHVIYDVLAYHNSSIIYFIAEELW